ncbi:hypothetical protein HMPREF3293_02766 [Christensenella minuta]|uniref:Uncharacterized protein n=1 Tax=Christensenella minuta TaxID=626937 RepID=A0A136Q2E9_9FIRM|nr:hypothetical protein HMPREF3293_02766 [Christensenella minuta]
MPNFYIAHTWILPYNYHGLIFGLISILSGRQRFYLLPDCLEGMES